jgi:L-alanine-DL-glutamate epimerase-like enolase superfamily enzyme
MKIVRLDVMRIALPFDTGRAEALHDDCREAYNAASPQLKKMETLLLRLTTDTGMVGWGEAFGHLINPVTFAALAGVVGRVFMGCPISADPASFSAVRQQAERALHAFGRTGPVLYALSAIDIALWDLAAKLSNKPLFQLLGATRSRVDTYVSLVSYGNDPDEVARQVQRAHALGYKQIKLHETDIAAIRAARAALPDDVVLMVDVNCPWNETQALSQLAQLRDLELGWLEEPLWPPDDIEGLARLRYAGTPIAAGENASGVQAFREHFHRGAVDVAQPSVSKIGGITAMLEVFEMARSFSVQVVPHCFYYGPGLLATAHLVACLPDSVALETPFLQWPVPLYPDFPVGPELNLEGRAGLGFEPDPSVLRDYLIDSASLDLAEVQA